MKIAMMHSGGAQMQHMQDSIPMIMMLPMIVLWVLGVILLTILIILGSLGIILLRRHLSDLAGRDKE